MKRSWIWSFALMLGLALWLSPVVSGHAFIDHCAPEIGSTVKQAPSEVHCTFTDAIDAQQTVFTIWDAKINQVDNKDLKADPNDKDGKTISISLAAAKMANGIYTVKWKTVAQDGDSTDGQWQFAVGTEGVPSVSIAAPTMDTKFDKDPADVVVTIKANNFQLGQGGRRWQVSVDDKVVTTVTDTATTTTLKAVPKGDHRLDVAILADDKTVVATAGMHLQIGAEDQMNAAPTAAPAALRPAPSTPAGGDNSATLLILGVGAIVVIGGLVFLARRRKIGAED